MPRYLFVATLFALSSLAATPALACSIAIPTPGWQTNIQPTVSPNGQIHVVAVNESGDAPAFEVTGATLTAQGADPIALTATSYDIDVESYWTETVGKLIVFDLPTDVVLDRPQYGLEIVTTGEESPYQGFVSVDPNFEVEPPVLGQLEVDVEEFANWADSECCTRQLDTCFHDSCDNSGPICSEEVCAPTAFDYQVGVGASVRIVDGSGAPGRYTTSVVAIRGDQETNEKRFTFDSGQPFEVCFVVETLDVVTDTSTRSDPVCVTDADVDPIERLVATGLEPDACSGGDQPTEDEPFDVDENGADDSEMSGGCTQASATPTALPLLLLLALVGVRNRRTATS